MRVYIAAPYPARAYVESLFPVLAEAGHECTSSWARASRDIHAGTVGQSLDTEHDDAVRHAQGDLYDVGRSDALFSLTADFCIKEARLPIIDPMWFHTGGRHVELGYALSVVRPILTILVGEPENIFQRALCTIVPDLSSALQVLA